MRQKIIEKIWQIIFDFFGILGAFALAYFLRLGTFAHGEFPFAPYFQMGVVVSIFWIFLLGLSGRYEIKEHKIWTEIKGILFASLSASLLFPLAFYFTSDRFFSRGIVLLIFILGVAILLVLSLLKKKIIAVRVQKNIGILKMLIIGADRNSERIIRQMLACYSYHKPVAILAPYGSKKKEISGIKVLGKLDALERVFESEEIDEIFLCEGIEHSENLASFCRNKGIPLRTSLETMGIYHHKILAEDIGNTTFLTLHQSPLFGWGQFFKRGIDLFFSLLGLIIFAPYFLIHYKSLTTIAYQNGIESTFIGYIFKNLSGEYFGKKIALLLSVLKKNASFIGPYLCTTKEYQEKFGTKKHLSTMRFILRPGIFSPSSFADTSEKMLRDEVLYIRHWSIWEDVKVVFKK